MDLSTVGVKSMRGLVGLILKRMKPLRRLFYTTLNDGPRKRVWMQYMALWDLPTSTRLDCLLTGLISWQPSQNSITIHTILTASKRPDITRRWIGLSIGFQFQKRYPRKSDKWRLLLKEEASSLW